MFCSVCVRQMYRNVICLFVVFILTESTNDNSFGLFLRKWTDNESLSQGEEDVDNIFSKVLSKSNEETESVIQPFPLDDLYFHNEEQNFSMRLYNMEGQTEFKFKVQKLHTVLPERRADIKLLLPQLLVEGSYEADRMAYGDFDSKASGNFRLTLKNVTAAGIAILKIENNSSIQVDRMRLMYKAKFKRIQIKQSETNPRLSVFIGSDIFETTVVQKIWLSVTYHLNKAVEDKVNPVLKRRPLKQIIRNKKMLAKYEEYVITTTENANKFVDIIVDYAKEVILQKYNDRIKIPDIREGFEKKVLFVNWRGEFTANKGTARGCHTVERTGETTFGNDMNNFTHFYGTFGFEHVDLFYDRFHAHFMGLGPSGSMSTKFFPLDLYVHAHVDFDSRKVYLDDFKVMSVGNLEVKLRGWGWLIDFLASKMATWIVGLFRDKIIYDLQNKYDHYISGLLQTYNLDDILEGKILR